MSVTARRNRRELPKTFAQLVAVHAPRPIGDDVELRNAEGIVERLAVLRRRTRDQEDYLQVLSTLIEKYDAERFSIDSSELTPLDRLKYLMEQRDMTASDLGRVLGDRTLGPKILNGERDLSKSHITKLGRYFKMNPGYFIAT